MRCFGHCLPKPTVLYANVSENFLLPLKRQWTRKLEAEWSRRMAEGLMRNRATSLLWVYKRTLCRTAVRFLANKPKKRVFHYKTRKASKSSDPGMWVNGGRDLAQSAAYTTRFCKAVLVVWSTRRSWVCSKGAQEPLVYRRLWIKMFGDDEDASYLKHHENTQEQIHGHLIVYEFVPCNTVKPCRICSQRSLRPRPAWTALWRRWPL